MSSIQQLICADNLKYIENMDSDSVDLIYFDPPFNITATKYDEIPLQWDLLWTEMWRVLKPDGAVVIHSSHTFTYELIFTQRKHYRYNWYWNKDCCPTGHLWSKKQPMRVVEEICVFYKKHGTYNPQMTKREVPLKVKGHTNDSHYYGKQSSCEDTTYTHRYPVHNLKFKRRKHKYSTRPVSLCEYIIKTYTNEGEMVLDLTCSDGQSAIACRNLQRDYIGIDIEPKHIDDAKTNYAKDSDIIII